MQAANPMQPARGGNRGGPHTNDQQISAGSQGRFIDGRRSLSAEADHHRDVRRVRGLSHLPPMGIGLEAVVANHDLALVRDMGGHSGDELQVVHRLLFGAVLAMPVADLTLRLPGCLFAFSSRP